MEMWSFSPLVIVYFTAALFALFLSFFSWHMRPVRGTVLFSTMMFFVGIWIIAYIIETFCNYYPWKINALKLEYVGMTGAVIFWVLFVATYVQYNYLINRIVILIILIIPVFTLINVFQAPNDTIIHESYYLIEKKGIKIFAKNYNWGFFLWTGYAYAMMGVGILLIIIRIIHTPLKMRNQLIFLIPVVLVVILPNIFFISDNNPIEPYDPTPIALAVVGILFMISIFFHKLLDVVPVAHNLVLKNLKSGVIILDSRLHLMEVNPASEKIIGNPGRFILGRHIFSVLPELRDLIESHNDSEEISSEILIGTEKKTYEVKITQLKDYSDNTIGRIIMLWDITEQKQALDELDSFARTVAHDLKTPLNHIMGFAKLVLEEDGGVHQEREAYIKNIVTGGEKMRSIIDGLLMLAKIRNENKIESTLIDMDKVINSVMLRLDETIRKSNAVIANPDSFKRAMGNEIWIEEVWINLITNAIKYGGNPPTIQIGSDYIGNDVIYWIIDNGNGLTKDEQYLLFTEFYRIHPKKDKIKGHGLGLSIVRRVMDKMGGEVGVESKPGLGSCFYFKLPREEKKIKTIIKNKIKAVN